MPMDLQAKLLRVLEERMVRRLGAAKAVPIDFRLISSTNQSPDAALRDGHLRQDLYFRINTVAIEVPPLRERRDDIPILVRAFLDRYRTKHARAVDGIEPEAYRRLLSWSWPGNVRELQHAIERAVLVTRGPTLTLEDLPEQLQQTAPSRGSSARRSSRRSRRRAGTSRPPPRCSACAARRSTPRCASTVFPSAGRKRAGDPAQRRDRFLPVIRRRRRDGSCHRCVRMRAARLDR